MPSSPATVLASNDFRDAVRVAPPVVHLLLAVLSVVVALRPAGRLRRAFLPLGALLQIVTATVAATIAAGVALLPMAAAAVGTD
jgi:hypothetical protein